MSYFETGSGKAFIEEFIPAIADELAKISKYLAKEKDQVVLKVKYEETYEQIRQEIKRGYKVDVITDDHNGNNIIVLSAAR